MGWTPNGPQMAMKQRWRLQRKTNEVSFAQTRDSADCVAELFSMRGSRIFTSLLLSMTSLLSVLQAHSVLRLKYSYLVWFILWGDGMSWARRMRRSVYILQSELECSLINPPTG